MARRLATSVSVVSALLALACSKPKPDAEPKPSPAAEPAAPAKSEPALDDGPGALDTSLPKTEVTDGLPTEEDYEEEASKVITVDNLESELDKLEIEIANP